MEERDIMNFCEDSRINNYSGRLGEGGGDISQQIRNPSNYDEESIITGGEYYSEQVCSLVAGFRCTDTLVRFPFKLYAMRF